MEAAQNKSLNQYAEAKAEADYQKALIMQQREQEFNLEQQKHKEFYDSPVQQIARLRAAGLNPYAFMSPGAAGETVMADFGSTPDIPDTEKSSELLPVVAILVQGALELATGAKKSELQNELLQEKRSRDEEMLNIRKEMLDVRKESLAMQKEMQPYNIAAAKDMAEDIEIEDPEDKARARATKEIQEGFRKFKAGEMSAKDLKNLIAAVFERQAYKAAEKGVQK